MRQLSCRISIGAKKGLLESKIQIYVRKEVATTYVLLRKRIDELGKNLVRDDSLSKLIRVVSETSKGKSGGLLDRGNIVQQEGSQKSHNT